MKTLNQIGLPIFSKKAHALGAKLIKDIATEEEGLSKSLSTKDKVFVWHWEHGMKLVAPEIQKETLAETLLTDFRLASTSFLRSLDVYNYSHVCIYYYSENIFKVYKIDYSLALLRRLSS